MDPETRLKKIETLAQVAAESLTATDDRSGTPAREKLLKIQYGACGELFKRSALKVMSGTTWDGVVLFSGQWTRAGIGYGEDDEIRVRTARDLPWMRATGPRVKALLAGVSELSRGIDGEEMCPRCGREQLWINAEVHARLALTKRAAEAGDVGQAVRGNLDFDGLLAELGF
jgi:hypothetical protein